MVCMYFLDDFKIELLVNNLVVYYGFCLVIYRLLVLILFD